MCLNKPIIRAITVNDAVVAHEVRKLAILGQCKDFYPQNLLNAWTEGDATDWFRGKVGKHFYVLEVNKQVVATGLLDLEVGKLDAIFVHPDYMRHGYGSSMMSHLIELAERFELKELFLESTLNAAPFYRQFGFVGNVESLYHSPKGFSMRCIKMKKKFEPTS